MRFIYLLICAFVLQGLADKSQAQEMIPGYDDFPVLIDEEHFPDAVFREYIAEADMDANGQLSELEVSGVTGIDSFLLSGLAPITLPALLLLLLFYGLTATCNTELWTR